jgi:hypothetical protein
MKQSIFILIFNALAFFAAAQGLSRAEKISAVRQELQTAFLSDNHSDVAHWVDSLAALENLEYASLVWDERWLLHVWSGNFGNLFAEVEAFDPEQRAKDALKNQPLPDSLYEWIDQVMYERRFEYFQNIQGAFLSAEEKAFATLLLEYLLRMPHDQADWHARLDAFERKFPGSRFADYVRNLKPAPATVLQKKRKHAGKRGGGLDFLYVQGVWRGEVDRSLRRSHGFDFAVTYWQKRWNFSLRLPFGWQTLSRDLVNEDDETYIWPRGETSTFFAPSLDLGFDLLNTSKVRLTPNVGGGFATLKPIMLEDDEGSSVSEYPGFGYFSGQLNAAINLDIKLHKIHDESLFERPSMGYGGIRLRFGYRWIDFGREDPFLQGNMFFFAVGYSLLMR